MTSAPFCDGIQVAWNCWLQVLKSRGKMSRSGKKLSKKSEGGRSSPVVVHVLTWVHFCRPSIQGTQRFHALS